MQEILEAYKKQSGDDLSDLSEKQIKDILELAYEYGHSAGIDECVSFMYDFVGFARDILSTK